MPCCGSVAPPSPAPDLLESSCSAATNLDSPVGADVRSGNSNHAIRTEGPAMDFVFWIIAIVLIVGVVWWLLNRNNAAGTRGSAPERHDGGLAGGSAAASADAAGTAGLPGAAGFGGAAEPAPPTTADDEPARSETGSKSFGTTQDVGREAEVTSPPRPDTPHGDVGGTGAAASSRKDDEWETQWSEAGGSAHPAGPGHAGSTIPAGSPASGNPAAAPTDGAQPMPPTGLAQDQDESQPAAPGTGYVHHPEYTGPHSPTLPGAETAAAETAIAEPAADDAEAAPAEPALAEPRDYQQAPEPAGLLAADQPYGSGSAAPGPDGRGPAGFEVKGDAGAMVYYEEGHPDYEHITGDVWFESAAHAEAAGFRAPRRTRR